MADAKGPGNEQIEDAEPGLVAQALVNLDEFQTGSIYLNRNIVQANVFGQSSIVAGAFKRKT
jgi:hypothetical protein